MMPVDPALLGFSNVWYPGAFNIVASSSRRRLRDRGCTRGPSRIPRRADRRASVDPRFLEALPGHLDPDEASQAAKHSCSPACVRSLMADLSRTRRAVRRQTRRVQASPRSRRSESRAASTVSGFRSGRAISRRSSTTTPRRLSSCDSGAARPIATIACHEPSSRGSCRHGLPVGIIVSGSGAATPTCSSRRAGGSPLHEGHRQRVTREAHGAAGGRCRGGSAWPIPSGSAWPIPTTPDGLGVPLGVDPLGRSRADPLGVLRRGRSRRRLEGADAESLSNWSHAKARSLGSE